MKKLFVDCYAYLLEELDHEKNNGIDINKISCGSGVKIWWTCKKGHSWNSRISNRLQGKGCPYCCGQKVCEDNCLKTINPYLTKEWHTVKNILSPSDITANSGRKAWWECSKGHEWEAVISSRNKGNGCPYCSGQKLCYNNSLDCKYPGISKEWHPNKNKNLPSDVSYSSKKKVWWRCENGHDWEAFIYNRTTNNAGCPYCKNKKICNSNCLKTINPDLAKEWNYVRNGNVVPENVSTNSSKRVWWICKNGHEWQSNVNNRSSGYGCPYCSGRLATKETCLMTMRLELLSEWNYIRNGNLTPNDVCFNSKKRVWWKCPKGHEWNAQVYNRYYGTGCPYCSNTISKSSQEWLDYLSIPTKYREITIKVKNKIYKVDALYKNTVYEFDGDFWHGNPEIYKSDDINPITKTSYKELYKNTIKKKNEIKSKGYGFISIWESDWNKIRGEKK